MQVDLILVILVYEKYVWGCILDLIFQVDVLDLVVCVGDRVVAQCDWLVGYFEYEWFGVVYDVFGNLDREINGLLVSLNDYDWIGFHLVEQGLWYNMFMIVVQFVVDVFVDVVC